MAGNKFGYLVILGSMIIVFGIFAVWNIRQVQRLKRQSSIILSDRIDQAMRWAICSIIGILATLTVLWFVLVNY